MNDNKDRRDNDIEWKGEVKQTLIDIKEDVKILNIKIDRINGLTTDVSWLKKWHWKIITLIIGALITGIGAIVLAYFQRR